MRLVPAAVAAVLVLAIAPAHANTCGGSLPCAAEIVHGVPDFFGTTMTTTCGGAFAYEGQEGPYYYWSGDLLDTMAMNSDINTRRISITCSVRSGSTFTSGTQRGSVTASSIAPLNNVVTADGVALTYYRTSLDENLWLCTTVDWVDRAGLGHTWHVDEDDTVSGTQCGAIVRVKA